MVHPGIYLQKEMDSCNMSRKELALRTGVSEKHICTIINGNKGISVSFANKLGYVFQNTSYWLDIQAKYDEEQLQLRESNNITDEEIAILKPLRNISEHFIDKGYMENVYGNESMVLQLRKLLNVSNLEFIPKITYNAAYRAQLSSNVKVDPYVLFAWQRLCEKETESISSDITSDMDLIALRNAVPMIKRQMFKDFEPGMQELESLFANCGIAFKVVKNFRGAPVQGFIKQTSSNRLILCMTIRQKRADTFWFTLFHEISHILNGDYAIRFVDFDSVQSEVEAKADQFAQDILIEPKKYGCFVKSTQTITWDKIEKFANQNKVAPFIVLGRLQKDGILDWTDFPDKVIHYECA